jgi:hypothetical protein
VPEAAHAVGSIDGQYAVPPFVQFTRSMQSQYAACSPAVHAACCITMLHAVPLLIESRVPAPESRLPALLRPIHASPLPASLSERTPMRTPEPDQQPWPEPQPTPDPMPVPEPRPNPDDSPVRIVTLPPDTPTPGIPIDPPDRGPMR